MFLSFFSHTHLAWPVPVVEREGGGGREQEREREREREVFCLVMLTVAEIIWYQCR